MCWNMHAKQMDETLQNLAHVVYNYKIDKLAVNAHMYVCILLYGLYGGMKPCSSCTLSNLPSYGCMHFGLPIGV